MLVCLCVYVFVYLCLSFANVYDCVSLFVSYPWRLYNVVCLCTIQIDKIFI